MAYIYNGHFAIEGKTYTNLMHLVQDFISIERLNPFESFEKWWGRPGPAFLWLVYACHGTGIPKCCKKSFYKTAF